MEKEVKLKNVSKKSSKFKLLLDSLSIKNFGFLTLAGIINAFGVVIFLYPVKLYDTGISGLSMFLDQLNINYFTLPILLLIINLPIFLIGLKSQGFSFTIYSVYTIGIYSLASFLIMKVLPINVEFVSPLAGEDLLLCAIFGGLISGVGSGITIRYGGAIDGIDVLSVLFAKRIGISIGSFVMIFNVILYTICGITLNSWILPLYSIVTYYVGSKTIDFIVEGFDRSKCAMIVTIKADEISKELSNNFKSSGTIVSAVGGYTKQEKNIVYFVVNRFQINKLKKIVLSIDPYAYISLQEVSDVIRKDN